MSSSVENQVVRSAALIDTRVESCLRASIEPMTAKEIMEYSGVKEVAMNLRNPKRTVENSIGRLVKCGIANKISSGRWASYCLSRSTSKEEAEESLQKLNFPSMVKVAEKIQAAQDLHLRINKAAKTIGFTFNGLNITIEVV